MPAKSTAPNSAADKLADNDAKLRNGVKPEPKAKSATKAPKAAKPSVDKATLTKAAKLRAEGATWDAIREVTGTKLGSSSWFRGWEREGIEHIPAGQRVKPTAETPAAPAPAAEAAPKPKRTVRRSATKK